VARCAGPENVPLFHKFEMLVYFYVETKNTATIRKRYRLTDKTPAKFENNGYLF